MKNTMTIMNNKTILNKTDNVTYNWNELTPGYQTEVKEQKFDELLKDMDKELRNIVWELHSIEHEINAIKTELMYDIMKRRDKSRRWA